MTSSTSTPSTPAARNDLGIFVLVTIEDRAVRRIEAVPLALNSCNTRLAQGEEAAWIARRFEAACSRMGTTVESGW